MFTVKPEMGWSDIDAVRAYIAFEFGIRKSFRLARDPTRGQGKCDRASQERSEPR